MKEKIKELIEEIRPYFNSEGGDLEFIKYEDRYVYVKLTGACSHCGFQSASIDGLEDYLKSEIPEIEGVINVVL